MTTNEEIGQMERARDVTQGAAQEIGATGVERCKPNAHLPGNSVVDPEVGETIFGGEEFWGALRDGETVTALCARCGARLEVSLKVRARRG